MKYLWIMCVLAALLGLITYAAAGDTTYRSSDGCSICAQTDPRSSICMLSGCVETLHDGKRNGDVAQCLEKMEAAMRAMDRYIPAFVDPVDRRRYKDSRLHYDDLVCRNCSIDMGDVYDARSLEQRLADEAKAYGYEQERRGRQIVNDQMERFAYQ